jgi:chromosomal replication initiator protein
MRPLELREGLFVVEVPSRVHRVRAEERVARQVVTALEEVVGRPLRLELEVGRGDPPPAPRLPRRPRFPVGYTFERFVRGSSNELAYRSAREVADRPGSIHNPLFLCGGVGLGKTHLATAVAHAVHRADPRRQVVFLSAEGFANEWIRALRANEADAFRNRIRRADVLIVDDVQFFAGKERLQEEFFHTFNELHGRCRQIVLASDQPPSRLSGFEERLRSRFGSGLIADIAPPEPPLRRAIICDKARRLGVDLPGEVVELLVSAAMSSVREIEGALHRLVAAIGTSGGVPDAARAAKILGPLLKPRPPRTVEEIQRLVAERFSVTESELACRRRLSRLALPRQVAMYLARRRTRATYAEIARDFGGCNHSTVVAAVRSVERRRAAEPGFAALLEQLEAQL